MRAAIIIILMVCALSGCASMPITEDGLKIDKDTSASIEDLGVGSVTRKF